jgi:hypothetical protein
MFRVGLGISTTIRAFVKPVTGLLWRNWTTNWTSLNNTWNTYN